MFYFELFNSCTSILSRDQIQWLLVHIRSINIYSLFRSEEEVKFHQLNFCSSLMNIVRYQFKQESAISWLNYSRRTNLMSALSCNCRKVGWKSRTGIGSPGVIFHLSPSQCHFHDVEHTFVIILKGPWITWWKTSHCWELKKKGHFLCVSERGKIFDIWKIKVDL